MNRRGLLKRLGLGAAAAAAAPNLVDLERLEWALNPQHRLYVPGWSAAGDLIWRNKFLTSDEIELVIPIPLHVFEDGIALKPWGEMLLHEIERATLTAWKRDRPEQAARWREPQVHLLGEPTVLDPVDMWDAEGGGCVNLAQETYTALRYRTVVRGRG